MTAMIAPAIDQYSIGMKYRFLRTFIFLKNNPVARRAIAETIPPANCTAASLPPKTGAIKTKQNAAMIGVKIPTPLQEMKNMAEPSRLGEICVGEFVQPMSSE